MLTPKPRPPPTIAVLRMKRRRLRKTSARSTETVCAFIPNLHDHNVAAAMWTAAQSRGECRGGSYADVAVGQAAAPLGDPGEYFERIDSIKKTRYALV